MSLLFKLVSLANENSYVINFWPKSLTNVEFMSQAIGIPVHWELYIVDELKCNLISCNFFFSKNKYVSLVELSGLYYF